MGFGGMSFGSLLLIFLIILLLFGTRRLSSIAEDLGKALRSFRKAFQEPDKTTANLSLPPSNISTPSASTEETK